VPKHGTMDYNEKRKVMTDAAKPILDFIAKRIKNKTETLKAYEYGPMDTTIIDDVKKMREIEAIKLRHEINVLVDLTDIINAIYPEIKS
jgi:hypothetical protein